MHTPWTGWHAAALFGHVCGTWCPELGSWTFERSPQSLTYLLPDSAEKLVGPHARGASDATCDEGSLVSFFLNTPGPSSASAGNKTTRPGAAMSDVPPSPAPALDLRPHLAARFAAQLVHRPPSKTQRSGNPDHLPRPSHRPACSGCRLTEGIGGKPAPTRPGPPFPRRCPRSVTL